MAKLLNNDYIVRAAKVARDTSPQTQDPLINYMRAIGEKS